MKKIKLFAIIALFTSNIFAQNSLYQIELDLNNEVYTSVVNAHYQRAEGYINQLKWSLKARTLANSEQYKQANALLDSVRFYKRSQVMLDASKAGSATEDAKLNTSIKALSELIEAGKLEQTIANLGQLKLQLSIKAAKESSNEELVKSNKATLKSYNTENKSNLSSSVVSVNINQHKIDSLETVLKNPESAKNPNQFSILQQELDWRKKIKENADIMRYLSASMDFKRLGWFLSDPQPIDNTPKPKFVATTANQKRMVWLQEKMEQDRKAGKFLNLWPMTQEYTLRADIEEAIAKGQNGKIKKIEKNIRMISFR